MSPHPPAVCPQPALRTGGGNASRADPGGLGSGSDTNWPIAKRGLQPARRPSAPGLSASARSPCSHKALLWACWNVSACVLWPQHTDARSRCQALGRALENSREAPGGYPCVGSAARSPPLFARPLPPAPPPLPFPGPSHLGRRWAGGSPGPTPACLLGFPRPPAHLPPFPLSSGAAGVDRHQRGRTLSHSRRRLGGAAIGPQVPLPCGVIPRRRSFCCWAGPTSAGPGRYRRGTSAPRAPLCRGPAPPGPAHTPGPAPPRPAGGLVSAVPRAP